MVDLAPLRFRRWSTKNTRLGPFWFRKCKSHFSAGPKSECCLNSKSLHTALNIYVGNLKQTILVCWTSQTLLYLICKDGCVTVVVFSRSSWWPEIPVSGPSFTSQSNRLWMTPVLHNCYRASVRTYQHRSDGDRPDFRRRRWRPTCFSSPIYLLLLCMVIISILLGNLLGHLVNIGQSWCTFPESMSDPTHGLWECSRYDCLQTGLHPVFLWTTHSAWRTLWN